MSHAKNNRNRHEHVINKLPISVGSDGYDKQNSYVMKNYITENSLCSIYGPSGSYKSFLLYRGRAISQLVLSGLVIESIRGL